ncbi:metal-dependent transcriptional regulator [Halocella sp. SP3-1]|uniref:metal-dependent transcriptional regulator n=1 Tax=Halocella sp. SP3-1 TaxID=2382161 RepID=UPI000F753879|nr:metal-dependent transcriptional regulator [Halocella sp. SP3-1]AZO95942.1 metal-dependent transcriptional regulator [Halocella sp. SP3-1]
MNRGEQDYIKAIYQLYEKAATEKKEENYISNNTLAEYLGHTPQTANETIKKLAKKDLLFYKPYKGCILTKMGREVGLRLVRVHRLWEVFLVEKLHYTWEEVHQEAEQLEHATSSNLEKKLYYFLKEPNYCPHGNPIPDLSGKTAKKKLIPLSEGDPGVIYKFKKVVDKHELLIYLNNKGITLGDVLIVKEKDYFSKVLQISKDQENIILGFNVSKFLFVEKIEGEFS